MRPLALEVPLRFFPLGGSAQRHHAADARIQTLGDSLDRATFSGGVPTFEQGHEFQALMADPLLQFHPLNLQPAPLVVVDVVSFLPNFSGVRPEPFVGVAPFVFAEAFSESEPCLCAMVNSKIARPKMPRSSYRHDGSIALIDGSAAAVGIAGPSTFGNSGADSGADSQVWGTALPAAPVPSTPTLESMLEVS